MHDVGLDHKVVSTTNHHKMFDIVTADEDDGSFSVDRQGFDYCYPRWCVAAAEPVASEYRALGLAVGTVSSSTQKISSLGGPVRFDLALHRGAS